MGTIRTARDLASQTFKSWNEDKAPRLGAALSYYTIFSLAPVLSLVISVAGLVFGKDAAEGRIVGELRGLLGAEGAEFVQTMLAKASNRTGGLVSAAVSLVMLVVGATGVFIELQDALNTIWKVEPKAGLGLKNLIRERLLSFGLILVFGFLLLVSLLMSAALAGLGGLVSEWFPGWVVFGYLLNYGVALAVITTLFAMIYKILPDVKIAWKDVWVGALVTSLLFPICEFPVNDGTLRRPGRPTREHHVEFGCHPGSASARDDRLARDSAQPVRCGLCARVIVKEQLTVGQDFEWSLLRSYQDGETRRKYPGCIDEG